MIRLGLCCLFAEEPIKFRSTTVAQCRKLEREKVGSRLSLLSEICLSNTTSLLNALKFCASNNIGCFRISSTLFPIFTHKECGYVLEDLPNHEAIVDGLRSCCEFAKRWDIRLSMHPDQFNVLNSEKAEVVQQTVAELEYHNMIASYAGVDVINIHGGGVYGDKKAAMDRFEKNFRLLSPHLQTRLTLENDDKSYVPEDLLPICQRVGIPLVYDVHHHRCCKDSLSVEKATDLAISTWKEGRNPMFHISSPIQGWSGPQPSRHHDFIDIKDFPDYWKNLQSDITVEVEAKQKEIAVAKLTKDLGDIGLADRLYKCNFNWKTKDEGLAEVIVKKEKTKRRADRANDDELEPEAVINGDRISKTVAKRGRKQKK